MMRAFLALLLLLVPLPVLAGMQMTTATIDTREGARHLVLELATTPETRAQGLMHRTSLAPYDGMVFLFPEPGPYRFWMKDTPLPLDMLFVNKAGTITHIAADTVPGSTTPVGPATPVASVIELDAGRAARDAIVVGDKVRYALPDSVDIR